MSVEELEQSLRGPGYDRTPPQDVAAEQSVLGGMMLSKDAIADVVEELKGPDFYRPAHELVYDAILDLYGRGEPADAVTVAAELTKRGEIGRIGGAPYLHTLISMVPTAANAGYYARIVRERAVLRRLVEAGTRIVQLGYATDGGDVEEIVNNAQAEIYAVSEQRTSEDYLPLADIINGTMEEIEAASNHGTGLTGVPTGFNELDKLTNGLHPGQMIVLAARPAIGKALALDTPLPTPEGWTTMGDVAVGDRLIGADGRPTRVVAATEVMVDRPCYEVTFDDGSTIVADGEHQWFTDTRASRRARQEAAARGLTVPRVLPAVRTTEEIAATLRCATADRRLNHSVPTAGALQAPTADLPVDPYAFGVWLGDGHSDSARFTSDDPEIAMRIEGKGLRSVRQNGGGGRLYSIRLAEEAPAAARTCAVCGADYVNRRVQVRTCGQSCGGKLKGQKHLAVTPRCIQCGVVTSGSRRCIRCHQAYGSVAGLLRAMGVLGNKHIPAAYLRASEEQRRELLAGLLDTDGTVNPTGSPQIALTSRRLAEDVRELVHSLGYRTGWSTKTVKGRDLEHSTAYTITFTTDDDVFALERKRLAHKERRNRSTPRLRQRFITSVRKIDSAPVRCVQVDAGDHLYLAGRSMIPTHNSTLGIDIARSAAIKHDMATVVFSLEMSRNEITMRLLAAEGRVPLQNMRKGTMRDEDWQRLASTMGKVSQAPLFIDDSPNMSLMEIRAKCRRLKQRHDLKLVVIDYLQLMSSGKRVESRQQEVSEFSRALKLLAKELEVPVIAISQLNRGAEQRTDKRPQMSDLRESGCLTASTRVLRADTGAETTMGELFAAGAKDVPVWSLDGSLRYVRRHLTHVFSTGVKETYRLRLASGKEIEATANHPFLTYSGWTPLGELEVGSRVAVPRHVPAPENVVDWSDRKVVLLAQLLGDGSFVRRQPLRYTLFGLRSHEKFVPTPVFHLPKSQIALFLRHLWSTDGSVTVNENGRGGRVHYASTSRRLVEDVSRLLLRFGISTRVRSVTKQGYRTGCTLDISGSDSQRRFLQEIGVHGARGAQAKRLLAIIKDVEANTNVDTVPRQVWDDVRDILTETGMTHRELASAMGTQFCGSTMWKHAPSRQRLARVAEVLDSQALEVMAVNDLLWDEVTAIEPLGEQEVFDATVVGNHNFVANGIAVHNSIEQDADVVILLHREDAYEKESPRAGEADVIVAKHRNGPTDNIVVAFQGHYARFVDMAPEVM